MIKFTFKVYKLARDVITSSRPRFDKRQHPPYSLSATVLDKAMLVNTVGMRIMPFRNALIRGRQNYRVKHDRLGHQFD